MIFRNIILIAIILVTLPLASFSQDDANDSEPDSLINDTDNYQPAREKKILITHTALDITPDMKNHRLAGKATLTLTPNFSAVNEFELDALGFIINEIKLVTDTADIPLKYSYNDRAITIKLANTCRYKDTLKVFIDYVAAPGELAKKGLLTNEDEPGLNFINTNGAEEDTPQQVWTSDQTQGASCWFPTIDAPNQRFTQQMYITTDHHVMALSNGELVYSTLNKDSTTTWYWKQSLPHAPYLAAFVCGSFAKVADKWRDIDVDYYVEPGFEKYARGIFGKTPQMLEFFSAKFDCKYPWEKFAQVAVRDYPGAMENTSLVVFGDFVQKTDRQQLDSDDEDIIAHELSHHWFGDLVTCKSWANLALSEGFATYCEYLWREFKYGKDDADYLLSSMLEEYMDEAEFKNVPLIRYHYGNADKELFDSHSYSKAALVLHTLHMELGNEVFFEAIKQYLHKFRFSAVEIHDLRMVFEQVSGQDLNWFFDQWFFEVGYPNVEFSYQYDTENKMLLTTVNQTPNVEEAGTFCFTADVVIYFKDSVVIKPVLIADEESSFDFALAKEPEYVYLDLRRTPISGSTQECDGKNLKLLYAKANDGLAKMQLFDLIDQSAIEDTAQISLFTAMLNDKIFYVRQSALEYLSDIVDFGATGQQAGKLKEKARGLAQKDNRSEVRAAAIDFLSNYDDAGLFDLYKKALSDSSYSVVHSAMEAVLFSSNPDAKTLLAQYEESPDRNIIFNLANVYIEFGNYANIRFYMKSIKRFRGADKVELINYFSQYLENLSFSFRRDGFDFICDHALTSGDPNVRSCAIEFLFDMKEVCEFEIDDTWEEIEYIEECMQTKEDFEYLQKLDILLSLLKADLDYYYRQMEGVVPK